MRHLWCSIFGYMCSAGGRKTLAAWVLPLLCPRDCTSEEPQMPMLLLLQLLSFCPFCERDILPGTWAASCCWCPALAVWRMGMWSREDKLGWAWCPESLQNPHGPGCVLAEDRQPRATSQLCAVTCPAPVAGGCRVVARVFFHGALIFILQVFYHDENKSLTVCVSLHYTLSALPSPPSLLPVLWKSGSE